MSDQTPEKTPEQLEAEIALQREQLAGTVDQLAALDAPVLIDVREPDEYAAGHAPGAVNLPMS